MSETCGKCGHWAEQEPERDPRTGATVLGKPGEHAGQCRRYPPQMVFVGQGLMLCYPGVPENWPACGEFAEKVPPPPCANCADLVARVGQLQSEVVATLNGREGE